MTRKKLQALTLALLMVVSSFAGVVALSGVAAAANDQVTQTDNTATGQIPANVEDIVVADVDYDATAGGNNVNNVSIDLSTGNDASGIQEADIGNVTLILTNSSGGTLEYEMPYVHEVTFEPSGTVDVTNVRIEADVTAQASDGDAIDAEYSFNSSTVASYDTNGVQTVTTETGFISGRVTTPSNDPVPNTTITVTNATGYEETTLTDGAGTYTIEVPPGQYDITAERENFTTASAAGVSVTANDTTTRNLVIRPKIFATDITVSPGSAETQVGGTITYTVTVTNNNGNAESGVDVTASSNNPDVTFTTGTTKTTDANGQQTFTVTSSDIADATLTFELTNQKGDTFSTTAEASFIPRDGEGYVLGEVYDVSNDQNHGLEGATVYAVRLSTAFQNAIAVPTPNNASETRYYRVINEDTGGVVDYNDYRIDNDGQNSAVQISPVRQLNTSNSSIGSGFAVETNQAGAGDVFVTPLEPGNYSVEVSTNQPNASDLRFADETAPTDPFTDLVAITQVTQNLTSESAAALEALSNANLVDETDGEGKYVLDNLYADGQTGVDYLLVAEKAGYERDYVVALVTADGAYFEDGEDSNFDLRPREIEPDGVDIVQIGTRENATAMSTLTEFDDQTDDTYQQISRDNSSVDVFRVNTTAEGELVNATVEVAIEDTSVEGEFAAIAGGTFVSTDNENNTATLYTGSDGQAFVWYQVDQGTESVRTMKTATLTNDLAVTDHSNVTFVGVTTFREASISGIVTDTNDDPLPNSAVWATQFTFGDQRVIVEPDTTASPQTAAYANAVDDDSDEFVITLYEFNATSGLYDIEINNATVTAAELKSYDFGDFPSLNTAGTDNFKLYDRTGDVTDSSYTLDPVPALDSTVTATEYRITAVKYDAPFEGYVSNDALPEVFPQTTDDANVVIPIDIEAADLQVSGLSDQTIAQGENTTVTVTVENTGGDQGADDRLVEFVVDGQTLATEEVSVASGDSVSLTLEGDTSQLAAGDYTMSVTTPHDSESATLTVESGSSLPPIAAQYDENGNGEIEISELSSAATDYATGDITIGELATVATAYSES